MKTIKITASVIVVASLIVLIADTASIGRINIKLDKTIAVASTTDAMLEQNQAGIINNLFQIDCYLQPTSSACPEQQNSNPNGVANQLK